jgi:hypothetical protein
MSRPRFDERPSPRFHFDAMDTLPYWYGPLAQVFNLPLEQVIDRAEKWIVDYLGFTNELVADDRATRGRKLEWGDTSNRQGSEPRTEDLQTYLEYHAMQLVAGQLLDEGIPVARGWPDDLVDPWREWIRSHIDASEVGWIVDLRSPTPLRPETYGAIASRRDWRDRTEDDFLRELRIDREGEQMVASSRIETWVSDRWSSVQVASALVSPRTATALMRALQSADVHSYQLPEEYTGEHFYDGGIDEDGFQMLPWLLHEQREEAGLEEHDPLRRISLSYTRPGAVFLEHFSARTHREGRQVIDPNGEIIAWEIDWDDSPAEERPSGDTYTQGRELWVRLPVLMAFLREKALDLLIEVQIARHFRRESGWESGEEEESYDAGEHRIFILRRDGELETVARSGGPGTDDRETTRSRRSERHPQPVDGPPNRRASQQSGR